ncbi:MAG: hypothetical protein JSV40_01840 [Deltaproteobacteria bacterium]|nr:MAG: hypothetical protein JSV40_01840 [Deltaproteobacteria bacterium]
MSYYFSKTLNVPFDEAIERVTEELMPLFAVGPDTGISKKATTWES